MSPVLSVICLLSSVFHCSFGRSPPGHTVRLATWQLPLFVISSFSGSYLHEGRVTHLAVSLGILSGSLPDSAVYSKFSSRSYRLDFFSFSLPLSFFAFWNSYPPTQSGPQLPPCRHALPARSCCLAAVSPMLLQWCAPLPPICRWMRAPLPSGCKWTWPALPFHQIMSITVANLGILSGSPLSSLSFPSFPTSSRHHLLFFKKKRSRPNCVASLGILSGSLPGSSCLSVPVGASLYSFLLSPSSSPSLFIPLPHYQSTIPSFQFLGAHRIGSLPLPFHPWSQRNGPPTLYDSRTMS